MKNSFTSLLSTIYDFFWCDSPKTLKIVNKMDSYDILNDNFEPILNQKMDCIRSLKPKNLIFDYTHLDFSYPVPLQVEVSKQFHSCFLEVGLEKFACVTPKDFIVYLSLEQIMDELIVLNPSFDISFFRHGIEAKKWMGLDENTVFVKK